MKSILTSFAKNQSFIFKLFLFILSTVLIIYLLPKGGQFKYNFQKGKPWQYENLYAPFSFTIQKSKAEIEEEKEYLKIILEELGSASSFKKILNDLKSFSLLII